jgi:hypothetical protein
MLSLHHQPEEFGGCGWSRTTNLALMRRLLFPFELHSRFDSLSAKCWKPAEQLNLVPFHPAIAGSV